MLEEADRSIENCDQREQMTKEAVLSLSAMYLKVQLAIRHVLSGDRSTSIVIHAL